MDGQLEEVECASSHSSSLAADFTAGWLAGAAGLLIGHPLDTVKVRQQVTGTGLVKCIAHTVKNESIFGLYKGMLAPMATTGMMHSFMFAGYGWTLAQFAAHDQTGRNQQGSSPSMLQIMVASNVGTLCQFWLAVPVDVVKIKLQVQQENLTRALGGGRSTVAAPSQHHLLYTGPLDCALKTYRRLGLAGLYCAGGVHLLRDMVGFNFYIPVYEVLLRQLKGRNDEYKTAATMLAGGVAGVAGWLSILPLDVLKSRLQAARLAVQQPDNSSERRLTALACARAMYVQEGVRPFFRGGWAMCLRSAPCNAVLFLVYQRTLDALQSIAH